MHRNKLCLVCSRTSREATRWSDRSHNTRGPVPITSLGEEGAIVPGTAGQGQFIKALKGVEAGTEELAPVEGAIGPAVVGSMGKGLRYLKWGGRVFMVIGAAAAIYEVASAPEEERTRTAVEAGARLFGRTRSGGHRRSVLWPGCARVLSHLD